MNVALAERERATAAPGGELTGASTRLRRVTPFAVDEASVQVVWGYAPFGPGARATSAGPAPGPRPPRRLRGRPRRTRRHGRRRAGPGHRLRARPWRAPTAGSTASSCETLPRPPGQRLSRVATVGDLHLGADRFGLLGRLRDPAPPPSRLRPAALAMPWPRRSTGASTCWWPRATSPSTGGASSGRRRPTLLSTAGVRHRGSAGQPRHRGGAGDRRPRGAAPGRPCRGRPGARGRPARPAGRGGRLHRRPPIPGSLRRALPDLLDALSEADRPALVCLHHALDPWPLPTHYPAGVPWSQARAALGRHPPGEAGRRRHQRSQPPQPPRRAGPLVVSEVASTKDFPGVWAGYTVYEGGIVQVVRRTLASEAMTWTERTRRALGGLWAPYAAGRRSDRCFSHRWPAASTEAGRQPHRPGGGVDRQLAAERSARPARHGRFSGDEKRRCGWRRGWSPGVRSARATVLPVSSPAKRLRR